MVERICPNCGKAYQIGDEVCRFCGYVFPFSTVELSRGTVLHGRYEVQEFIHTGGMGYVYLARDKTLFDRPCIVKQIREPIKSEDHRRKLEEEALRMASLNNPNIAMILDHFIENGRYFLIVERIRGKTLLEVFRERQSLMKEEEVVKWAIGICDVIAYIHKEGVIHRDISPDNIMLTDEGTIKFIDFGTLREFRYVATGGTAGMGKYGYTPPEQWQGKPEPRSDIFALGATIYYLLTGFLPLSKELTTGQPPQREDFYPRFPPIRMNNPKVSPQLELILQKALQLDVANRFASVGEMRQALKNLEPVTQPVARIPGKKFTIKSRKSLAIMGVIVACLIGVVLFLTLRGQSSNMVQFPAHMPKISGSSQMTDTPLARETVTSQYTPTSPDIDGILTPGEWPDTGFSKSFKYTVDDVSKDSGVTTVYFMNDSSELYVAINISAPDFKEQMFEKNDFWFQAYITYDGNSDGVIKPGERFRGFEKTSWDSGKMTITEAKYKTAYLTDDGYLTTDYNTTTYGAGAAGYHSPTQSYVYECSIPLNSGDEKDLNAKPGDNISINIIVYQYFRYGDSWSRYGSIGWPGNGGVIDIDAYGILALATGPGMSPQASTRTIETPQLKWSYYVGDTGICSPVIGADGTVYTCSAVYSEHTPSLYAFNPDGSLKWKQNTGEIATGMALAPDGTIYAGCYTGLYSFNVDGSKKWSYSTEYSVTSPVIGTDGTVYITSTQGYGSNDSYLYAVKPDGSLQWKYKINKPGVSSPAVSTDGTIYVCSMDVSNMEGELLAVGQGGSLKWRYKTGYSNFQSLSIGTDGAIVLGTNEGITAINTDGSLKWSQEFYNNYSSLNVAADGTIYVYVVLTDYSAGNETNESLYCISKAGSLKWKRVIGTYNPSSQSSIGQYSSPKAGPDGTVYVGSLNDDLVAFGPDGSLKWSFSLKTTADVPPDESDSNWKVVYAPTTPAIGKDGTIYIGAAKMLNAIGVTVSADTSSPIVSTPTPTPTITPTPTETSSLTSWFPFTDNSPAISPDAMESKLIVRALNATHVYIDLNYNDLYDSGEPDATLEAGQETAFDNLSVDQAIKLVSDGSVDAYYQYNSQDYGVYDDNHFAYSACPLGTKFVVPFGEFLVIGATQDSTRVNIEGETIVLNTGQIYKDVAVQGLVISADKPIAAMVYRNNKDTQDNSYATELLPESEFGTEFWLPANLSFSYVGVQENNQKVYFVYADGRVEVSSLSTSNMIIATSQPAAAYCLFDVWAKDPWAAAIRHYTHAYPIPAVSSLGTEYAAAGAIISTHDKNIIEIDSDFDGIFEDSTTLNAGEEYNPLAVSADGIRAKTIGHVRSKYPIFVRFVDIGRWGNVDESTWARIAYPI